jgi:hypothetical protein
MGWTTGESRFDSRRGSLKISTEAHPVFYHMGTKDLAPGVWNLPITSGRTRAQAGSRRLPTAAIRVQSQVKSYEICCGQSGTGAGFLRVLQFPLPILIPPNVRYSSGAGTIGQLVADVSSGLSLTPPHETKTKTRKNLPITSI